MTEDLDKDLAGLTGDLDNLDLGDVGGGDEPAASAGAGGGESIELDADLQAMLSDTGDSAEPAAEAGGGESDNILSGGGESDDILAGGGESDNILAGGSTVDAPARRGPARAPTARPAPPPTVGLSGDQAVNLEFLLDIKLHVTFEVGRSKMLISDLLTLGQGSVIELRRLVGDELDLLVNGKLIAKGEVVVVNEKFGCKITDIVSPEDRIKHLGAV